MVMILGSVVVLCDSIFGEEEVDCFVEYRVKFKYDYNMKYVDVFLCEVGIVIFYVFDDNGKLVYQKIEEGDVLGEEGYIMKVDLELGDYYFVIWVGLNDEVLFLVFLVMVGEFLLDEL